MVRPCRLGGQRFGDPVVSVQWEPERLQIADHSLSLIPHSIGLLRARNSRACRICRACQRKEGWCQSPTDGGRRGGDGCENERAEWQPRDRLIFSSFPIPLSSSPVSCRSLYPNLARRLVEDKFCWAPLYWIYELMEMSRHNRLGNKEENRRWRRLLFALPLSLMWRAFGRSRSKLHRISEAMLSMFSVNSLLQRLLQLWSSNRV